MRGYCPCTEPEAEDMQGDQATTTSNKGEASGPGPLTFPPMWTVDIDVDTGPEEVLTEWAELSEDLYTSVARARIDEGLVVDLEYVAADATARSVMPGVAPGVRMSRLLGSKATREMLWDIWSRPRARYILDNRDGTVAHVRAGVVAEVVRLRVGALVAWLGVDRSEQLHWRQRALTVTERQDKQARAAQQTLLTMADRLFEATVVWTVLPAVGDEPADAVVAYLNDTARTRVHPRVTVGRRVSELVAPEWRDAVVGYLVERAASSEVDERRFGPGDFSVHLLFNIRHGRVRTVGVGESTVVAFISDDSATVDALDQARSLFARLNQVRDDEDRHLATVLHDGPVQSLVAARMYCDALFDELPPEMAAPMRAARDAVAATEAELRAQILTLTPPSLETTGLSAAVAELARAAERHDRQVHCALDGAAELGRAEEMLLVRCAQELLRNIDRHAHAGTIWVELGVDDEQVRLVVADDGIGFDASDPRLWHASDHFGLVSSKTLLQLSGGGMWADSTPGAGAKVTCWLPRPTQADPRPGGGLRRRSQ
jgi:signal transduction histidine kinase